MKEFIDWLAATEISLLFQTVTWVVPTIQTVHILCLAVLFTSMMMLDFRLLGLAGMRHSVENYSQRFLPWLWGALPILLITGIMMIIAEPKRDLENFAFYFKMTMLVVACVVTYGFQRAARRDPPAWELSGPRAGLGKLIGAVSILLWVGIIISGRMIAYV